MDKKNLLRYVITFVVGVVISALAFLIITLADNSVNLSGTAAVFGTLGDCFTVSGVLLMGVGGITFANRKGTFDALGYSLESVLVVRNLSPKRRFKEREAFADYKERKTEERKTKGGIAHYFITGACFIALAVGCVIVYATV